jgi:chemotaxis protein CheX
MSTINLKVFSKALQEIFNEVGVSKTSVRTMISTQDQFELVSSLGITGDMQGYLILKAELKSAKRFVEIISTHMGMEMEEEGFGTYHKAAIAEITNQISGRATMLLSEEGFDCSITPPTIVTGNNIYMQIPNLDMTLSEKIEGDFGFFGFFVGVKNVKKLDDNS